MLSRALSGNGQWGSNTSNSGWEIFVFQSAKSMKFNKYLLAIILAICIVPSVALASWWNPLSWKIFQKREVPVQEIIKDSSVDAQTAKIIELQKQINDLKKLIPVKVTPSIKPPTVLIVQPQIPPISQHNQNVIEQQEVVEPIVDEKETLTKEYRSKLSIIDGRIATLLAEYKSDLGELKIRVTSVGNWTQQDLNSQIQELTNFANMNINALKKDENSLFLEYKSKGLYTLPPPNNNTQAVPDGVRVGMGGSHA